MTGKTPSADSRIPRGPHADSSPFALARRPPSVPKRERPAELWPPLAAASGRPVAGSACDSNAGSMRQFCESGNCLPGGVLRLRSPRLPTAAGRCDVGGKSKHCRSAFDRSVRLIGLNTALRPWGKMTESRLT